MRRDASLMSRAFSTGSAVICERTMRLVIRCSRTTSDIAVTRRPWPQASSSTAWVNSPSAPAVLAMGASVLFVSGVVGRGGCARLPEQSAVVGLQRRLGFLLRVAAGVARVHPLLQLVLGDEHL